MALKLVNLDPKTRDLMIQEIDRDIAAGILHISEWLNPQGVVAYPSLLKEAAENRDDSWLKEQLLGKFNAKHEYTRNGKIVVAAVPDNAAQVLAEWQFNCFYVRGLCLRAGEDNIQELVIYRVKSVKKPHPASEARLGKLIAAVELLNDLRTHIGVEPALGVPRGPGSGISAKLP